MRAALARTARSTSAPLRTLRGRGRSRLRGRSPVISPWSRNTGKGIRGKSPVLKKTLVAAVPRRSGINSGKPRRSESGRTRPLSSSPGLFTFGRRPSSLCRGRPCGPGWTRGCGCHVAATTPASVLATLAALGRGGAGRAAGTRVRQPPGRRVGAGAVAPPAGRAASLQARRWPRPPPPPAAPQARPARHPGKPARTPLRLLNAGLGLDLQGVEKERVRPRVSSARTEWQVSVKPGRRGRLIFLFPALSIGPGFSLPGHALEGRPSFAFQE